MEPPIDMTPIIPAGDIPDNGLLTLPSTGKLKQSRYEDVWPEDVHAAFMEAVALYPPMGKRRLKYYRVSMLESEKLSDGNQAKSFGRCQLIQSYILEKTGQNRSRKQVSSHLQRLKKIHKDNPALRPLFSERFQPPAVEHFPAPQTVATSSQDIFANISFSTRHLKSNFDLTVNLQDTNTGADSSFSYASEASSLNADSCNALDLSTNLHDQPSFLFPQEFLSQQQCPPGNPHPSDNVYLSEFQDPLLFKNAINGGFRAGSAFNTSAFSISMCRLTSKLPIQSRQVDSGSTTHISHVVHSPGVQPTHQWTCHDGLTDGISCDSPLTTAQQAFRSPVHPPQLIPQEKQRLDSGLVSDWMWLQNPDIHLGPREGTFDEVRLRYPPTMYHYNPTCPVDNSPASHGSPSESEISRLPKGVSHPYAVTSPETVSESVSNESAIDFLGQAIPELSENLASPLVIRPTPVYPVSYIHPKTHSDGCMPASSLLP